MEAFPAMVDRDFASHYTDLYVVASPELMDWLKVNYEWHRQVTLFVSPKGSDWNGAGRTCLDIPFAHESRQESLVSRNYRDSARGSVDEGEYSEGEEVEMLKRLIKDARDSVESEIDED
jgi:hypothetical protein